MRDQVGWFIAAIVYIAIIYTLVKPGSTGTQIVGQILGAFTDLVRGTSGQTFTATSGTNAFGFSNGNWSTGNS
jgi:hypothetical protein